MSSGRLDLEVVIMIAGGSGISGLVRLAEIHWAVRDRMAADCWFDKRMDGGQYLLCDGRTGKFLKTGNITVGHDSIVSWANQDA